MFDFLLEKMNRLKQELGLPTDSILSQSIPFDAKAIATLAYLRQMLSARILRYIQDPALHALIYGSQIRNPDITV